MKKRIKVHLPEDEMPRQWYNILADMPSKPRPPLHPGTRQPLSPGDLAAIFPMGLIEQEASGEGLVPIPEEVLDKLMMWRPTPLQRATALEECLETPARIYYKNESLSPAGSHKPNTAVAQAYYNQREGVKRLSTETGAGQWGCALSFACSLFGLECQVFMVRASYDQKPYRRLMMQTWGATCTPSPSPTTQAGRHILERTPDSPGSLGIAISEAVEVAASHPGTKYALGSVLNHVMLHQTVIGLEAQKQLATLSEYPDVVIGCVGGGSNFAGLSFPYLRDKIHGKKLTVLAIEPTSCPTLTRGPFAYDFGDTAGMTPLLPMHTLGHDFIPAGIHAGGLRYHGMSPLVSQLVVDGLVTPLAIDQLETFQAGITWSRTEGSIPAPETCHAIAAVIREAKQAKEEGQEKVILFNYSGHGLLDLSAYDAFLSGRLTDHVLPEQEIERALSAIRNFPKVSP